MLIKNYPKLLIRIPHDVKNFLRDEAINNCSSQNAEVVRAVRAVMKEKGVTEAATSSRHVQKTHNSNEELSNEQTNI